MTTPMYPGRCLEKYGFGDVQAVDWVGLASAAYATLAADMYPEACEQAKRLYEFTLDYMIAACLGETRHSGKFYIEDVERYIIRRTRSYKALINKTGSNNLERAEASELMWDVVMKDPEKWLPKVEEFFLLPKWNNSFGGFPWAFLAGKAKEWYLTPVGDPLEYFMRLDTMVHAAHCGAPMLVNPKFSWIRTPQLLTFVAYKRYAQACCWPCLHSIILQKSLALSTKAFEKLVRISPQHDGSCFNQLKYELKWATEKESQAWEEQQAYIEEQKRLKNCRCLVCGGEKKNGTCLSICATCHKCWPKHKTHCNVCLKPGVKHWFCKHCNQCHNHKMKLCPWRCAWCGRSHIITPRCLGARSRRVITGRKLTMEDLRPYFSMEKCREILDTQEKVFLQYKLGDKGPFLPDKLYEVNSPSEG